MGSNPPPPPGEPLCYPYLPCPLLCEQTIWFLQGRVHTGPPSSSTTPLYE